MATAVKLGPHDHGRTLTRFEYEHSNYEEGHRYELIAGKLIVSPVPNLPHEVLRQWLVFQLWRYATKHPDLVGLVSSAPRVVAEADGLTQPEPDVALLAPPAEGQRLEDLSWADVTPFLVVEVLSPDNADKDTERSVELYVQVPTIREYWIVDGLDSPSKPTLIVYRRRGTSWQKRIDVPFGATYTTKLLPGFTLVVDPHHRG